MTETMPTMQQNTPASGASDPNAKQWLVLATYLIPLVLIYTMMEKGKEPFYVWHSKNAAGAIVVSLVLQILYRVLWMLLPVSLNIVFLVLNLVNLALAILLIYGAYQGWQGKQPNLPVLTAIGQKVPLEKWFNKDAAPATNTPEASTSTPETNMAQAETKPTPEAAPSTEVPTPMTPTPEAAAPTVETPAAPEASNAPDSPTPPEQPQA